MSTNVRTAEVIKAEIAALEVELKALTAVKVSEDVKSQIMLAIKNDPKTTNGKYYTTFAAFIVAQAAKKYGTTDQVKDTTWLAAAKGYGIAVK